MRLEVEKNTKCYYGSNNRNIQKYLLILLFTLFTQFSLIKNERHMKITNIECKLMDPNFANITECKMRAIQRDITEFSFNCILKQKPVNNATMHGVLRKRGVVTGKALIDFEIDCCAFIRNKRRNFWAALGYNVRKLETHSNINHTCPYDHDLIVDKYRISFRELVKFIPFPPAHYTWSLFWYSLNVLRGVIDVHFQIFDI